MDEADSQSTSERKPLRVGQHQRTITARPVSVTCEQCHQTTTRLQYPGYHPRYCSEAYKQIAHRERDRQRKAAQRARARICPRRCLTLLLDYRTSRLLEYRANIAGHPDDPMSQQRSAILQPIATALQDRLIHAGPVFPKPGVLYQRLATAPAYHPPHEAAAQLLLCRFCEQPILFLIHAEAHGTLEDYARDMFEIYREKNLPTFIAGPPIGEGPVETLPADLLQVWPERSQVWHVPTDEFRALLDALRLAHCNAQTVCLPQERSSPRSS